jgi:hypothetical protein
LIELGIYPVFSFGYHNVVRGGIKLLNRLYRCYNGDKALSAKEKKYGSKFCKPRRGVYDSTYRGISKR